MPTDPLLHADLLLHNGRLVTPDGVIDGGWLTIRDGLITGLGTGAPPHPDGAQQDLAGRWLLAGFIDIHCHGGMGHSLYAGDADGVRAAAAGHLDHGTTTMLASIGTADLPSMLAAAQAIATTIDDGSAPNIAGIHFEGPFLSPERRGAQTLSAILDPDERVLQQLLEAAGGHAKSMTVAPERPGARELIERHRDELVFCLGHTDASAEEFQAGIEAGAHHVTHLFNAMPPLQHRAPGPIARALLDPRVTSELIADGHHLADDTIRLAVNAAGSDRLVLVTDAMAAAGLGDGEYSFVDRTVTVEAGVASLRGTTTLAGSTLFLSKAVERVVTILGLGMPDASRMAATNAARVMGWSDRGRLAVGLRADLVVLDDEAQLRAVIHGGAFTAASPAR